MVLTGGIMVTCEIHIIIMVMENSSGRYINLGVSIAGYAYKVEIKPISMCRQKMIGNCKLWYG